MGPLATFLLTGLACALTAPVGRVCPMSDSKIREVFEFAGLDTLKQQQF